jgi:hypothetical protein
VVCSLLDASLAGAQCGASGLLVQGRPWANPFYPTCAEAVAQFVGAGLAWGRNTAAQRLGCLGGQATSTAAPNGGATKAEQGGLEDVATPLFEQLVAHHLYGGTHGPSSAADVATACGVLCCSRGELKQCWAARRQSCRALTSCRLDEPLWQLHAGVAALPWALWADSSRVAVALGDAYKAFNRKLRAKAATAPPPAASAAFARQEGLRWASADAFSLAVASGSPAQQSLDALHVCLDLLRLSCRLLQQVLHVKDDSKAAKDSGASSGGMRPVAALVKRIPASTRSDLANRFLDLYQRLAVLWGKHFCASGLPLAFRHPPELLQLLTFDLPNFQTHEMYDRILAAKRL